MEQTALIILITGIIMVTYIPCLASQHPDNDDDGISPQSSESRTHAQKDGDLEGPYTFGRGHHRRNDRKSGGSRHGDRKSEHRSSHDHANRGRASSSKESTGTGNSNRERCPPASFMNRSSGICVACSSCPINQIIRRPCSAHRDTVCGPFYEFQQQQRNKDHSQSNQQEQLPKGPASAGVAASASDSAPPKTGPTQSKKFEGAGIHGDESAHSINTEDDGVGQTRGPTVQSNADQWRELCYGLIGALAVVTLLALIYIIITQIQARRHTNKYPDAHRTVLTPTMRVFANGFLGTTDYQKITPQFEDGRSRRPQNWLLRHLKRSLTSHAQPNRYVMEGDVILPISGMPEVVEMERIQVVPPPPPADQDQGQDNQGQAAQGQAAQGHAGQGQRLESTQSWDSGIGTQEVHRQA